MEAGEIYNVIPKTIQKPHVMMWNDVLTLFVTPSSIDINQLKATLLKTLPTCMVPTISHALDHFTLNKNGKLDVPSMLSLVNTSQ